MRSPASAPVWGEPGQRGGLRTEGRRPVRGPGRGTGEVGLTRVDGRAADGNRTRTVSLEERDRDG
jgi:hypothetical protein